MGNSASQGCTTGQGEPERILRYYVSSEGVDVVSADSSHKPLRRIAANRPFLVICHGDEAKQATSSRLVMPDGVVLLDESIGVRLASVPHVVEKKKGPTVEEDESFTVLISSIESSQDAIEIQVHPDEKVRTVRQRASASLLPPGTPRLYRYELCMGELALEDESTLEEEGVEESARLLLVESKEKRRSHVVLLQAHRDAQHEGEADRLTVHELVAFHPILPHFTPFHTCFDAD